MKKLMSRKDYDRWIKTLPKDVCPFCQWQEYQIVLFEGYEWIWIANIAPYWKNHTLLVPKRHFTEYEEMTNSEAIEFKQLMDRAVKKYKSLGFKRFVHFWRKRLDNIDPKTGKLKVSHFHVHLCNDFDGLWDPILDTEARKWDIDMLK
jgi:diadenosine tetraphosphate (Ap4A) HIT family hydrolase